jgi:rSAM/selenodomain-associated transferase 2
MKISIIIPIYNEEKTIEKLIGTLEPLKGQCEILFVDGGSTDRTLEILGDRYPVIHSQKGRAWQMNLGAEKSTGDVLFFLHCDSEVPSSALEEIEHVMKNHRAGCFGIAFHSWHFFMFTCRVISNHRIKDRKVMFGDQGIFVDRELFFEVGMFPEIPIMEDYQFSLTLKERGIKLGMTKHRIYTSARRFEGNTIQKLKIMWKMNRLRAQYRDGVPIEQIAEQYKDVR